MHVLVGYLINQVASILLGPDVFPRILGIVQRWAEKEVASAEKRKGVLAEIEIIGLELTESMARFGVELAVQYLKKISPSSAEAPTK